MLLRTGCRRPINTDTSLAAARFGHLDLRSEAEFASAHRPDSAPVKTGKES
jgi:hypothetical protein